MVKFNIKQTRLVNEKGQPLDVYHATQVPGGIQRYYPLSHFGTDRAARMRAAHFIYQALQKDDPAPMTEVADDELIMELGNRLPPLSTQKLYLYMRHPKRIPDLINHNLAQYRYWFENRYEPKRQYLSPREMSELDALGAKQMNYKRLLTRFIFSDPFTQTRDSLMQELACESLFKPNDWQKNTQPPAYPSYLRPVLDQARQVPFPLAEQVTWQRLIRFLEGEGIDGFKYMNDYEDMGNFSYIIFRPEQVFNALTPITEQEVPTPNPQQAAFLLGQEQNFFSQYDIPSPTERIMVYRHRKLEKIREILGKNK